MLRRNKPLKRSGNLKRTPLKRVSPNKRVKQDFRQEDNNFYKLIWEKRPHICRNCGEKLGREPLSIYFHHVLEKRNFKEYRHKEWNIIVLCWLCHQNADQNKIELVNRYKQFLQYKIKKRA